MIPLRIFLKNFLTYRGEHTFDFDGASLWVLSGANGSGKSSVFDAITFTLFNRHRAGGSKAAKSLINHKADSAEVEFDFCVDNQAYRIRRTIAKYGQSTRQAYYLPAEEPVPNTDKDEGLTRWVNSIVGLKYDAFTSSILLLQEKSTKLLDAEPRHRLPIFEEILNLAPYKRLHELSNNYAKSHDFQAKELQKRLGIVPVVAQEDLEIAQARDEEIEKKWQTIQVQVRQLGANLEQSKQWKQREEDLNQLQSELVQKHQLRDRTSEIERSCRRLQELNNNLPVLSSLIENQNRATEYKREIDVLEDQIKTIGNNLVSAEQCRQDEEIKFFQLNSEFENLQKQDKRLTNSLLEIAPVVAKLSEVEEAQTEIEKLDKQIANMPENLEEEVQTAEDQDQYLQELEQFFPWLEQLSTAHNNLSDAWNSGLTARREVETLEQQLQEHQCQRESLGEEVEATKRTKEKFSNELNLATNRYEELCQKLQSFTDIALKPVCDLCGQEITPEHAAKEKARLEQQIAVTLNHLDELKLHCQAVQKSLEILSTQLKDLETEIGQLKQKQNNQEKTCEVLRSEVKQYAQQIRDAFENLPESYQGQIASFQLLSEKDCLKAVPPSMIQLQILEQKKATRKGNSDRLKELRSQFQDLQKWHSQQHAAQKRLSRLLAESSLEELRQSNEEQAKLQQERQHIESQLEHKKYERDSIKCRVDETQQDVQDLSSQIQSCEKDLSGKKSAQMEAQRIVQSNLNRLSEDWRELTEEIDASQLQSFEIERDELVEYDKLWIELQSTDQYILQLQQQIDKINSEIATIPIEAQRPEDEIQKDFEFANTQFSDLDGQRLDAVKQFEKLKRDYEQRLQLEQKQLQTERQHQLYKHLAELLGPKGLQLHLLRQAERAIVELANETLDSLSRGRLRLELRNDCNDEPQAEKALDLVVYDSEAGATETAIALTSGSQRFRIAVSLALAIGRYSGQEARCIESVIIDEGFGGLDKNGRDDMIQELSELQQQLKRIILVSHQEEFASAFTNGYFIELVDGSSQISKLIP